jgi:hypothetical protein
MSQTPPPSPAEMAAMLPPSPVPEAKFVNVDAIPWTYFPGYEDKAAFKLLRIDMDTLGHTYLFKYRTGIGPHRHFGAVEILTLKGRWWYEGEGSAGPGDYTYEYAGATHVAVTENDDWVEALIISKGPLQMINEDGSPGLVVDAFLYYHIAAANNAVAHLPYPFAK